MGIGIVLATTAAPASAQDVDHGADPVAQVGAADAIELGADLGYGGSWWTGVGVDAWYGQHALLAVAVDARIVLAGTGLLAFRAQGSVATSVGVGELACTGSYGCTPSRSEERAVAEVGGGGRITLLSRSSVRLALDWMAGVAAAWVATQADRRGAWSALVESPGDRGMVGGVVEVRGALQLGADLSLHAGLRVRPLFVVDAPSSTLDVGLEGSVGLAWVVAP